MSVNKRVFYGGTLGVDQTGGTSYTTIGAIIDGLKGPDAESDVVETTLLSDNWATFAKTLNKPGKVTFKIAYDPDDASGAVACATMMNSMSAVPPKWQITFPSGSLGSGTIHNEVFSGWVTGMSRPLERKEFVTADITITVSGDPGFANV